MGNLCSNNAAQTKLVAKEVRVEQAKVSAKRPDKTIDAKLD